MATFDLEEIRNAVNEKHNEDSVPITVILDNVRTPDNIGALTRVAAALGCKRIISTKGCADMWSPKALRASAGAHFQIPIFSSIPWEEIPNQLSPNSQVFLADNAISQEIGQEENSENTSEKLKQLQIESQQLQGQNGEYLSFC